MTIVHELTPDPVEIPRLWSPVGTEDSPPVPLRGPAADPKRASVALRDVADTPCLILLGEAGMGKTHEVRTLAAMLRQQGHLVDLVQGRDPDLSATLQGLIAGHEVSSTSGQRRWHIMIDDVDEIDRQSSAGPQILGAFLDRLFAALPGIPAPRLVFACRTSAWTDAFDAMVERWWQPDCIKKLELLPLDDAAIEHAVARLDPAHGGALRDLLANQNLRAIAGRPLLLRLLVDRFAATGAVPASQSELLQFAIEQYLSLAHATPADGDISARVTVAARIAAAGTFSGMARFTTAIGPALPDLLSVTRIAGGMELPGFLVTPALLTQCLRTPLFAQVAPDVFEWTHRAFSEFLTARYLVEHGLSPEQILSLLMVKEAGGPGGIAPQLSEVAAWVAALSPAFFETLVDREPELLLQSETATVEPARRARLAAAILKRVAAGTLFDRYQQLMPLLARLDHDGLGEQIAPFIADRDADPMVRRVAIDMAAATAHAALAPTLVEVAADARTDGVTRSLAARAAGRLGGEAVLEPLGTVLRGDLSSDTDDRLRGALLSLCWPAALDVPSLLEALTPPKNPNLIGTYQLFLHRFASPPLSPLTAIAALGWLQQRLDRDDGDHGRLLPVMGRLFRAASAMIADTDVRAAMARFIVAADIELGTIVAGEGDASADWPDAPRDRAALVEAVLQQSPKPLRVIAAVLHFLPGLVRPEDLDTYLARLEAVEPSLVDAVAQLVIQLADRLEFDKLERVWQTADRVPALQSLLDRRYKVEIGSVAADQMRQWAAAERERAVRAEQSLVAASQRHAVVADLLDRIEAGNPELWWQLNLQLFHTASGAYEADFEFRSDLATAPGWLLLADRDRQRVTASALRYLVDAPLQDLSWLGSNVGHRPASAGLRALRLLRERAPDQFAALSAESWAQWAPVTIGFFENDFYDDGTAQRALLREAYRRAPAAILAAVRHIALDPASEGLSPRIFALLATIIDSALVALLESLREDGALRGTDTASAILSFLVRTGDEHAAQAVRDALSGAGTSLGASAVPRGEVPAAATQLLLREPGATWLLLLDVRHRAPDLARAIWASVARSVSFDQTLDLGVLPEFAVAQAYLDLDELLPDKPPRTTGARAVGDADHVERLREMLLARLVAAGSNAALQELSRLETALPDERTALEWHIDQARRMVREKADRRLDPVDALILIGSMGEAPAPPIWLPGPDAQDDDDTRDVPLERDLVVPLPVPAGPLPAGERRVILAVATEWSSGHGGVSTLNRELCIALAELGHTVLCLVLEAAASLQAEARRAGVRLITCPQSEGIDGDEQFLLCQAADLDVLPQIVIGHDHITGPAARALATRFGAQYVHFLHTIPQENEGMKRVRPGRVRDVLSGAEKLKRQIKLAGTADLIVAVGPRIRHAFQYEAPDLANVTMLLPGLNPALLALTPVPGTLRVNRCLMMGRMEDAGVKGTLLALDAMRETVTGGSWKPGRTPKLIIRGFDEDKATDEFEAVASFDDYAQLVEPRAFSADPQDLRDDYRRVALSIMPSRAEGFGLTGLEAIAAGVPVILSRESGLAEYLLDPLLNEGLDQDLVEPCVAIVAAAEAANLAAWSRQMADMLQDHPAAFARASALRAALRGRLNWDRAARLLSVDFLTI